MNFSDAPARASRRSRAFTLIELLVVIAIIAILAAILFPVFAQAKFAAKKTVALSNVKQIAVGSVLYGGDFDDNIVPLAVKADLGELQGPDEAVPGATRANHSFELLLDPYIKNHKIWSSPGAKGNGKVQRHISMAGGVAMSFTFGTTAKAVNYGELQAPAEQIIFADGQPNTFNTVTNFTGGNVSGRYACEAYKALANKTTVFASYEPYVRYVSGANYALGDGHAKFYKPEQTLTPYVMWFVERPDTATVLQSPQGDGGFNPAPAAQAGALSPTTNCAAFQFWNGRG